MKNTFIFPWNEKSESSKALGGSLDIRRIKREHSLFKGGKDKTVINWGSSKLSSEIKESIILNSEKAVNICSNKLHFFQSMSYSDNPPRIPEWTTNAEEALEWVANGFEVLGRAKVSASGGEGIIFSSSKDDREAFMRCPLFTKYKKKHDEFRVHIVRGKVIDVQQKKLRTHDDNGAEINPKTIDFRIRNHSNGFIFARNEIDIPKDVIKQASLAFDVSTLDFGAVDVIYNGKENAAYVLEINTAPGLQGTTVTKYVEAFKEIL